MTPENGSRKWRTTAEILGVLLVLLSGAALVLFWQGKDLRWLLAPPSQAEDGGSRRIPSRGIKPPSPAEPAPVAPQARVLSLDGLKVEKYSGEQAQNPALQKVLEGLDASFLDSVKDLKDRGGLYPTALDKVWLVPRPKGECLFQEPFQITLVEGGVRLEVPVEPLALGWWDTRELLASGLAASILLQEAPRYAEAPSWLRYGVALHLSGYGSAFSRRILLESERPPLQMVRPLGEGGDLSWMNGYWSLKALSARKGNEAVLAWIDGMRAGKGWEEALQGAASESLQVFDEQYRAWATAYLKEATANRQTLLDAIGLLRHQKEQQALPILEEFVASKPLDLYAGNARYYLNYTRYRLGDYEGAIDGFTDLLVNAPATTCFQAKAHYFMGRSHELAGYAPVAAGEYRTVLLEPDNPLLLKLAQQRLKEIQ